MTLTLRTDEFGTLTRSGALDEAIKEPDFNKKAIRLFNFKETLLSAFDKTETEIDAVESTEADKVAEKPGRIGFSIGAVAAAVGFVAIVGAVSLPILGFAALAALAGGFGGRGIARAVAKGGPETEAEDAHRINREARKSLQARADREIEGMDNALFSQEPAVRDEFRAAFRHAALKQEVREDRIHRIKMEQEAEETASAARTAATMSTIAAMNTAMAASSRR